MLADVPLAQLSSDELHARNAWAQVYLVRSHDPGRRTATPSEALAADHRDYLRRLESASAANARRIATDDPFHRAGHRTNTVHSHIINEGVGCYVARAMSRRGPRRGGVLPGRR